MTTQQRDRGSKLPERHRRRQRRRRLHDDGRDDGGELTAAPQRDRGSTLPLVLVLMVVAGLVVVPLMTYTSSVLRANSVVSARSKNLEAAKGGLRAVLGDPANVFSTCVGSDVDLGPEPEINGVTVDNQCWLVDDVGSAEALGGEIPYGNASLQLGSTVPGTFIGAPAGTIDSVSAGGTTTDWWVGESDDLPTSGTIWLPHLPRRPSTPRTATPFEMPAAFRCKVFFPGVYSDPIDLDPTTMGTDHVYFASGVYVFAAPITVSGDIDVVVGYGIEDFGDDCADDLQVAANVTTDPGTFGIDGGGATWVLEDEARLIVDDTDGSPSIRFNQRYAGDTGDGVSEYEGFDRGRRINIMTVNGDARAVGDDHAPLDVNFVPRSQLITDAGDDVTPATIEAIDGTGYVPSSIELTDAERAPEPPQNLVVTSHKYDDGGTETGALLVTWDAVVGQDAGGAVILGYGVTVAAPSAAPVDVCPANEQIAFDDAGTERVTCLIRDLSLDTEYTVAVIATNTYTPDDTSAPTSLAGTDTTPTAASPVLAAPDAPTDISADDAETDDVARVSWTAAADNGAPITRYDVTATRVFLEPRPDLAPIAENFRLLAVPGTEARARIPAYDPNGDALTITVDNTAFDGTAAAVGNELIVLPDPTAAGNYLLDYVATDPTGNQDPGTVLITVDPVQFALPAAPVAFGASVTPDINVDATFTLPAFDPNGPALGITLDTSDPAFVSDWTITSDDATGTVTIHTTAPDGTYTIPYTVDDGTTSVDAMLDVIVERSSETAGSCTSDAEPPARLLLSCDIPLPDLVAGDGITGNLGYRFDVTADNGIGVSPVATTGDAYVLAFDGTGLPLPTVTNDVEPYVPTPVIEVLAGTAGHTATVQIPGYVAVPMGRVSVENPDGDPVSMTGGVLAGTFDVPDEWTVPGVSTGVPIGFWDQVILQRTVRIVTGAGRARSIAIVQVNEDGDTYAINSWSIQ